ncbi:hypothetical protein GGF43_005530 [Coemansia sp. RSA 2618]|nr:hypothetical protein GGF43_005530 [Coemansia sp. RSA 2618]
MRKSGKVAKSAGFKGLRITPKADSKPTVTTNAFDNADDETGFQEAAPMQVEIVEAQGDEIAEEREDLVIPAKQNKDWMAARDTQSDSDVDDGAYERVAIEDFGAAMLRGMGWKGDDSGKDEDLATRARPSLLGLGATALPKKTEKASGYRRI